MVLSLSDSAFNKPLQIKAIELLAKNIGVAAKNEAIKSIGKRSLTYIKRRTARGMDKYNNPFKSLTPKYSKEKRQLLKNKKIKNPPGGVRPPNSNLYKSGRFYNSLHARIMKGMTKGQPDVTVKIYSTEKKNKVLGITNTREVFGLTPDEEGLVYRAFTREFRSRVTIEKALQAQGSK